MPQLMMPWEIPSTTPDVAFGWDGPWSEPVDGAPIDRDRTAGLAALAETVRCSGGTPLQVAGRAMTRVTTWSGWFPTGQHSVPLPDKVWLLRNGDDQWFGIDTGRAVYWECSAIGPSWPTWRADSVRRFDLALPWNQRVGLAGGGIPIWALIARNGELRAGSGGVQRALNLSVAGDYAKACVPWISKTDGTLPPSQHPLRSGERLRLTAAAYQRLTGEAKTADDFATLWALRYHGVLVNDKTAPGAHSIRMPIGCVITVKLKITDFEVVAQ